MKLIAPSIAFALIFASAALATFDDPKEIPTQGESETTPPVDTNAQAPTTEEAEDVELQKLPAPMRAQVKQALAQIMQLNDPAQLHQALEAMEIQSAKLPPQAKPMMEYMKKKIQARIQQLEDGAPTDTAVVADGDAATQTTATDASEQPAVAADGDAATEMPATDAAASAPETAAIAATPAANQTPAAAQKAMDDFLYGVLAGRKELAQANATFLLEPNQVTNQQLAQMIDGAGLQERLSRAVRASKGMGELAELATQIEVRVSAGRLELSRDPARIDAAIIQLGGTMRQQSMAKSTLIAAGSYAVPALLKALFDTRNPQLQLRASQTLADIGRGAVLPLCVILPTSSPQEQVAICNIITVIHSKLAAPWLAKTVRLSTTSDVRNAASTALRSMNVSNVNEVALWSTLARDYFVSRDALTPYPGESQQVVWSIESSNSILPKIVPTEIYGDIMAMQCAQEAMRLDPNAEEGLSIYLAAGLRSQTPLSKSDGTFSMESVALAAGSAQAERVLRLAREVNDPGLTLVAIQNLSKTASESVLLDSKVGNPILECLSNSSRSIRMAAALAIAQAKPQLTFQGAEKVVPILGGAIQQGNAPRTVIVASDDSQRRALEGKLSQIDCVLLASDASASAVLASLSGHGAADLIIASGGADEMKSVLNALRTNPGLSSTPMLMVIPEADEVRVDRAIRQDPKIMVWFQGRSDSEFQAAAKQLISRTIGGVEVGSSNPAAAVALQQQTLRALRDIGSLQESPLKVSDAERDLIEALSSTTGETQILVAKVLAVTPTVAAQRALIDAALSAVETQQIALLQSLSESGRLYGNQAEEKQIDRLRQALLEAKGETADALAQAYGALRVGTAQVLKLILK